ncbi:MAG: ABC transporter substrate-binding protein [Angelakisella sp.]
MKRSVKAGIVIGAIALVAIGAEVYRTVTRIPLQTVAPAQVRQPLVIWAWDDTVMKSGAAYEQVRPDVALHFVAVDADAYTERLKIALATFFEVPDICTLEKDSRAELLQLNIWENLENEPYSISSLQIPNYMRSSVTAPDGSIAAIPYDISVSGVAYRKSLAERLLGDDSPAGVQAAFPDWEAVIANGGALKAAHPDFFLFASPQDIADILLNQTEAAYVQNGVLVDPARFLGMFEIVAQLRHLGLIDQVEKWSPSWYNSFPSKQYLFYPCAIWTMQYRVFSGKNDRGETDWGLAIPPGGSFSWGGTAWSICKFSQKKELAFDYLSWFLLSEEGAIFNKEKLNGVFIHYMPIYNDPSYMDLYHEDFGDVNVGNFYFKELFPAMKKREIGMYDQKINHFFKLVCQALVDSPQMTAAQARDIFIDRLLEEVPQLTVPDFE